MPTVKALTKEQAKLLLPEEFRPAEDIPGKKQYIRTPKGIMTFHHSSRLNDGGWKTSHSLEEVQTEIDYVLFAMGYEGILILPRTVLIPFFNDVVNGRYSGDRFKINVYKERERLVWRGRGDNWLDVTEWFVAMKPSTE